MLDTKQHLLVNFQRRYYEFIWIKCKGKKGRPFSQLVLGKGNMKDYITVIGGGLAGTEAAYQIAKEE